VAVAPSGEVWVSGWKGQQDSDYVARFDGSTWVEYPGPLGSIVVTPDGQPWGMATGRGLLRFDGQAWVAAESPALAGLAEGNLLSLGPDGALWILGAGSIAQFVQGAWHVVPTPGTGRALALAPDGTVWLATDIGLAHLDPVRPDS
jgi:streptogramin lyase